MEKLLTIIIPTYNMEKYLPKCLDSLIIEEHLMSQLDIIVVNDGSKDSSSEIAHTYEKRFPDSITVIDKQNGNYGSCINAGLEVATGKYIRVLDSDDSYDNKIFQLFVEQLAHLDVDLVVTNYAIVDESDRVIDTKKCNMIAGQESFLNDYKGDRISMHAITYKRNVFNGWNYHQTEGVSYTDTEWIIVPMLHVVTMIYLDLNVYNYLVGREGQTVDKKVFVKKCLELLLVIKNILTTTSNMYFRNKCYVDKCIMHTLEYLYHTIIIYGNKKQNDLLKVFDKELQNDYNFYFKKLNQSIVTKFSFRCIYHWRTNHFFSNVLRFILRVFS